MNMAVNWVHFFAESYYSAFVRLLILMLLGVNPVMFGVMVAIDTAWGIFIHAGENTIRDGRLGILHHLIITPAHHRAHHAKDPLYLDTNFANVFPLWDWIFGTLQPLRKEVKANYGILRELDVTNFSDLYFGELFLLYRDIRDTRGIKNKLLYLFMPPGWTPASDAKTAPVLRREFLKANPTLGVTSKQRLFAFMGSPIYSEKISDGSVNDETNASYSPEVVLPDTSK
jgi:sterol desaturase/sphingolipid hydroxylase (fatty acid hydroxylase superfamily)